MKYKLVWEMHGPDAHGMAEHHAIHLEEFAKKFNIEYHHAGTEKINENFSAAVIVVNETDVETMQKSLRPHHTLEYSEQ